MANGETTGGIPRKKPDYAFWLISTTMLLWLLALAIRGWYNPDKMSALLWGFLIGDGFMWSVLQLSYHLGLFVYKGKNHD